MITNVPATFLLTVSPNSEAVREDAPSTVLARGLAALGRSVAQVLAHGRTSAEHPAIVPVGRSGQVLAA